jgi:Transposase, Mutator family
MRTRQELYPEATLMCTCELECCPTCQGRLSVAYVSGPKTVQTLQGVLALMHLPKRCLDPACRGSGLKWPAAQWQQIAPRSCTYGYDVIAQVGWLRQTEKEPFEAIQTNLTQRLKISETQVRSLYHGRYLPLLACHERQSWQRLRGVAAQTGLILSLDGLAPEGGEPQLWVVRELRSGLTLRSGWLAKQDEATFVNFLQPLADLGLWVRAILSDKQRGLVPAVAVVFPQAKHSFCQLHYLQNAAAPVAEADESMKVALRQGVRQEIGDLIRQEEVERSGVLTTTGLVPSPAPASPCPPSRPPQAAEQVCDSIRQDLRRRVRYLLTLKGRPPLRLAGIEMFERLTQVKDCLGRLLAQHADPELEQLHQGLQNALRTAQADYTDLRQAADWLAGIADLLDPAGKPNRSGTQVKQALSAYLEEMQAQSQDKLRLQAFYQGIEKTTRSYASGLFHCYDVPGLPRTNNDRESEFRDLNRRLLATTGQKGLVRRILQREGAWEVIPRPPSLDATVQALAQVDPLEFQKERQRVWEHRNRFRLHTRSVKQSRAQLNHLEQRWVELHATNSS